MMSQRTIAQIISAVFHPVFLIQVIFQVVIFSQPGLNIYQRGADSLSVFIFLLVMPVVSTMLFIKAGRVLSWEMQSRRERKLPYLVMGFLSSVLLLVFTLTGTIGLAGHLPFFGVLLVVLVLAVNSFWKISIHLLGMGGLSAFLLYSAYGAGWISVTILSAGLVLAGILTALARIQLKAHNPAQLVAGWIAGFLATLLFFSQAG